jgi:CRP-like cAMP-binding protein
MKSRSSAANSDELKVLLVKSDLLARLPNWESNRLARQLTIVHLTLNQVLFRSMEPARYVYFPVDAVISVLATTESGRQVEVSISGREGIVGVWPALGAQNYRYEAIVHVPGRCLRMSVARFREALRSQRLLNVFHRYLRYLLVQIAQTATCNRVHPLSQRLARWLLMTRQRVEGTTFPMTHEFLANMLGAERSDVSQAARSLRNSGLIDYHRGMVTVLNRQALESAACECYRITHEELLQTG